MKSCTAVFGFMQYQYQQCKTLSKMGLSTIATDHQTAALVAAASSLTALARMLHPATLPMSTSSLSLSLLILQLSSSRLLLAVLPISLQSDVLQYWTCLKVAMHHLVWHIPQNMGNSKVSLSGSSVLHKGLTQGGNPKKWHLKGKHSDQSTPHLSRSGPRFDLSWRQKNPLTHELLMKMLPENVKIKKIYRGTLIFYVYTVKI